MDAEEKLRFTGKAKMAASLKERESLENSQSSEKSVPSETGRERKICSVFTAVLNKVPFTHQHF